MLDVIGKGTRFLQRMKRRIERAWQIMNAEKHYYTSLESYAQEYPEKAKIISERKESLVYAKGNDLKLQNAGQISIKHTHLHNVICYVYSDVIELHDGRCLYELKECEYLRPYVDYTDEIILKDTDSWCKLKKCHKIEHISKAIKIGGMFGFNYYHFMYQILPRMFELTDIDSGIPLLLDKMAEVVESMRQLVQWCNFKKRDIIYMDYDIAYHVDELYTITSPNMCVPNWKDGIRDNIISSAYSQKIMDVVYNSLIKHAAKEKIYANIELKCDKFPDAFSLLNKKNKYLLEPGIVGCCQVLWF